MKTSLIPHLPKVKIEKWFSLAQISLIIGIGILALIIIVQLVLPINVNEQDYGVNTIKANPISTNTFMISANHTLSKKYRAGLFKPAIPIRRKPITDNKIAKILANYELKYITKLDGQWVAYIKNKRENAIAKMKNNNNNGIFTILNITSKYVDISIMEQKHTLRK